MGENIENKIKNVRAAILTIGEEILYGHILDTNANFISNALAEIGIKVVMHLSVGDNLQDITDALHITESRSDVILITGGLGPTNDDITKKCLANYFNTELKINQKVLEDLSAYFKKRGFSFSATNRKQAELPENAEIITNEMGTAPAMWFEERNRIFISMPGVPHEMKYLITEKIIPRLEGIHGPSVIYHKVIMTAGLGESWLSEKIAPWEKSLPEGISLAYLPSWGQVKLRITAKGKDRQELVKEVEACKQELKRYIGKYMYGEDEEPIQEAIGKILISRGQTLSVAESCTGGYITHLITSIPGSSNYFLGGMIAYSNSIKQKLLGVKPDTINRFGAVSEETVKEMAGNLLDLYNANYAIATSGIAGPGGGTEDKPVGTVWIAVADKDDIVSRKYTILKDRLSNIKYASVASLILLWQRLSQKN
jgi:nicotinamide-nucleotide amidase